MYPTLVNLVLSLLWLACGLAFLKYPAASVLRLGYGELSADALVDIRASFGGICLAVGLATFCLQTQGKLTAALALQILILSGYAGGRFIGLFLKSTPSPLHRRWLAAELTLLTLALTALLSSPGAES